MNPGALRQFAAFTRTLPQPERARMARNAIIRVLAARVSPYVDETIPNGGFGFPDLPPGPGNEMGPAMDALPAGFVQAGSGPAAFAPPRAAMQAPISHFMPNALGAPGPVPAAFSPDAAGTGRPGLMADDPKPNDSADAHGRSSEKSPSATQKQKNPRQTDHASQEAIKKASAAAIPRIKAYVGSRDISEGAPEDGAAAVYNTITGKTRYLFGPEAGWPDGLSKFRYSIDVVKGDIVIVIGHSHPKADRDKMHLFAAQRLDRENEGISHNPDDKKLVRKFGVLILKTPSSKVKVCRKSGRFNYSCQ
jgi:hypothetical protein